MSDWLALTLTGTGIFVVSFLVSAWLGLVFE